MAKISYVGLFCIFLLLLPAFVRAGCSCEKEKEGRNKFEALKYKLVAIASILSASAIGVGTPSIGKFITAFNPQNNIFFMIKAFAAGVILSTGFIHVLPDAFENLTSPCLNGNPWGNFSFTGFVAMLSAIGTLMVDAFATSYYSRHHSNKLALETRDEENPGDGHSHGSVSVGGYDGSDLLRHRVISQVLELGIVVHSIIIGISVGASESPKIIRPLVPALTFHQLFEGMGLGGCISQTNFKARTIAIMALFFSLTTPIGIVIGIGVSSVYNDNSPTALIVEGILNAASAGILIYMALVDLLAADFLNTKVQNNGRLQFGVSVSLLLGAGCMTLLAKWA